MTSYAWPGWSPSAFELRVASNVRSFTSPYAPTVQAINLLGERLVGRIDLPPTISQLVVGQREAFFDRLQAQVNRITLWNLRRPVPLGTARGTLTLGANVAQLASTVTIAGAVNRNILLGSSFELDGNSDGVSDGWDTYTLGTTGTVTPSLSGTVLAYGAKSQRVAASGIGTTSGDRVGIQSAAPAACSTLAGGQATYSIYVQGVSGASITLYVNWYNAGGTNIDSWTQTTTLGSGISRPSLTGNVLAAATSCRVYAWMSSVPGGGSTAVLFDCAQLEAGALTSWAGYATLLAGDMVGLNGTQTSRVMADAVADDSGSITVEVLPRARVAMSAGAAVSWNKPTFDAILKAGDGVPIVHLPGMADGLSFEFVEAL